MKEKKWPIVNCGFCGEPYAITEEGIAYNCSAVADCERITAYYGSRYDLSVYAWMGEPQTNTTCVVCDKCLQKMYDNEDIYLVCREY